MFIAELTVFSNKLQGARVSLFAGGGKRDQRRVPLLQSRSRHKLEVVSPLSPVLLLLEYVGTLYGQTLYWLIPVQGYKCGYSVQLPYLHTWCFHGYIPHDDGSLPNICLPLLAQKLYARCPMLNLKTVVVQAEQIWRLSSCIHYRHDMCDAWRCGQEVRLALRWVCLPLMVHMSCFVSGTPFSVRGDCDFGVSDLV